jgi:hypothetical protein
MFFSLLAAVAVAAEAYAPVVAMTVTLPDGQARQVTAPESGLATVALADGAEFGFRPTIQDDRPWNRVVVTIFRMPTASRATEELGEVEVRTGAGAIQSRTSPAFKIAVTKVTGPTT